MQQPNVTQDDADKRVDTVGIIADALTQKFGDRALPVAKFQRDQAGDETLAKWNEVVARLQG